MSSPVRATANAEMQPIISWTDVAQFAGRVVALKTHSFLLGPAKGFVFSDESIQFAYIEHYPSPWSNGQEGYNMDRLLKLEQVSSVHALVDSDLNGSISMRLASSKEINLIADAILKGHAQFEYCGSKEKSIEKLGLHKW